jgi:hypothetical protein
MNLEAKKWCYYIPETQDPKRYGGYVPSLVFAHEPGHSPMMGRGKGAYPWIWGETLTEAKATCKKVNLEHGVSEKEACLIIASSMGAERTQRRSLCV